MRYGIGYKGSKSRIANEIIEILPSGDRFIDLFGGGGAMSHCAALSGKYNKIIYNDINPSISSLMREVFSGVCYNRSDLFNWVSRERFFAEKENNPIIRWIWSFSNNGKDYMYSKVLEPQKEAVHKAIVNKEYSNLFFKITNGIIPFDDSYIGYGSVIERIDRRKSEWYKFLKHALKGCGLYRTQALERLINIQDVAPVYKETHIEVDSRSYKDYMYWDDICKYNDIVYCDPPYQKTNCGSYSGFNSDEFWEWARQTPCYISEYTAPDDFECIWQKDIKCLSRNDGNSYSATEKLFKSPACDSAVRHPRQLSLF